MWLDLYQICILAVFLLLLSGFVIRVYFPNRDVETDEKVVQYTFSYKFDSFEEIGNTALPNDTLMETKEQNNDAFKCSMILQECNHLVEIMKQNQQSGFQFLSSLLVQQFENQNKILLHFPMYNGLNLKFTEWQEKVEAIIICNQWSWIQVMRVIPTSLEDKAKISFDALSENDKQTLESFFLKMSEKLDPNAKDKNMELFLNSRKNVNENIVNYVDRCKKYIKRCGIEPSRDMWVSSQLKEKIRECLSQEDQKLLKASIPKECELDLVALKADIILNESNEKVIIDKKYEGLNVNDNLKQFRGKCGKCDKIGHKRKECKKLLPPEELR